MNHQEIKAALSNGRRPFIGSNVGFDGTSLVSYATTIATIHEDKIYHLSSLSRTSARHLGLLKALNLPFVSTEQLP